MNNTVYLSFGSNIGNRESNIIKAVEMVSALEGLETIAYSPIYLNQAAEMAEPAPDFLNMVMKSEYLYSPLELLNNLEVIERKLGRQEKGQYKPRAIDIDILLFGNEIIETERLSIPHRRLTMRPFFLVPLLQIDPQIIHPVTKQKIATYLGEEDRASMILYKEYTTRNV